MITKFKVAEYREWFDQYIEQFLNQYPDYAENINIKAIHSRKVSEEIVCLAESLNLEPPDVFLAEIIGLLHDIGRFEQYVKYQTFSDLRSEDHAKLGVTVLREMNLLKDLNPLHQEIVLKSIFNHNRAEIIFYDNEKINFFSKLIRDADKLDIWRVITDYYIIKSEKENKSLELDLPDTRGISDDVYNAIINHELVRKESINNLNDFKLLQIGWLFDLNFSYSIKRLYLKNYLQIIFDTLPDDNRINYVKKIVERFFSDYI